MTISEQLNNPQATPEQQQRLIEAEAASRREKITEAYRRLGRLSSWVGLLEDAFEMGDELDYGFGERPGAFFGGTGGIPFSRIEAESLCYIRPSATSAYYINETQLFWIIARSRAFASQNDYWVGIDSVLRRYAIGAGHVYGVVAKDKADAERVAELKPAILERIKKFIKRNRYVQRQKEKVTRKVRDGGYDLRKFVGEDGLAYVRFVEPRRLHTPPGKSDDQDGVCFGVQYDKDARDYETPLGYWVQQGAWLNISDTQSPSEWIYLKAEEVQHRTVNVDMATPRGIPTTYFVQKELDRAKKTLEQMGQIVGFRSKIGAIRKMVNAQMLNVRQMLQVGTGASSGPGGDTIDPLAKASGPAVVTTSDQMDYQFPPQGVETDKIVASIQADLRAASAATGLAEFMVSADASNANYSSTMVAESVPVQTITELQQDTIEEDLEILEWALRCDEEAGELEQGTMDLVELTAEPPIITARDRLAERQADEILVQNKAMSRTTLATRDGLDPGNEQQQIEQERDSDAAYGLDDVAGDELAGLDLDDDGEGTGGGEETVDGQSDQQQESLREAQTTLFATPILEIPDVRQINTWTCGPAATIAVAHYYGVGPATVAEAAQALGTTEENGTDVQPIVKYLQSLGLQTLVAEGMTIDDLRSHIAAARPVIVNCQDYLDPGTTPEGYENGHWMVAIGVVGQYVILQDPSIGNALREPGGDVPAAQADPEINIAAPGRILVHINDWMKVWHDADGSTDGKGTKHDQLGIAVGPPAPAGRAAA